MKSTYQKSLENVREIIIRQVKANATNRLLEYIPNYKERIYLNCLNNTFKDELDEIVSLLRKDKNIAFFCEIDKELYSLAEKVLMETSDLFHSRCQDLEKEIAELKEQQCKEPECYIEESNFDLPECCMDKIISNLLKSKAKITIASNFSQPKPESTSVLWTGEHGISNKVNQIHDEILKQQVEPKPELVDKECFNCPAIIKANPNHDFVLCDKCESYWGN